ARHAEARGIAADPALALLRAERDDEEIGAARVDARDARRPAERLDRAVAGRLVADADDARALIVQALLGRRGDAVGAAVEIDRERLAGRALELLEEVRARDALDERDAAEARRPDERHAVGDAKIARDH